MILPYDGKDVFKFEELVFFVADFDVVATPFFVHDAVALFSSGFDSGTLFGDPFSANIEDFALLGFFVVGIREIDAGSGFFLELFWLDEEIAGSGFEL